MTPFVSSGAFRASSATTIRATSSKLSSSTTNPLTAQLPPRASVGAIVIKSAGDSVAAHRNRGARAALGSLIAFADSDHEIDRHWIETAVDVLSDPTVAATGSAYLTQPSANWVQQQYDGMRSRPLRREEVSWLGQRQLRGQARGVRTCRRLQPVADRV